MSAGAVFTIIANEGKVDNLIFANNLLKQRIADIMCEREEQGESDLTPTLADIEETHILYMNAHYRPVAAIGFEYNKVRSHSGVPAWSNSAVFNLPQFGDFFHDICQRTRLSSARGVEGLTPTHGGSQFPLNSGNDSYNIVDSEGNLLLAGDSSASGLTVSYRNYVRYCERPADRLFKSVKFDVQGNPLDEYTEMVPVMMNKFCTSPNKRTGSDRLAGQEVCLEGYGALGVSTVVDADSANTPAGISKGKSGQSNQTAGVFEYADVGTESSLVGQTALSTLNNATQYDVFRELKSIVNGPQTPKPVQPALELWNRLHFGFCKDAHQSIPSVSLPSGHRFITMEYAAQSDLIFEEPSIYLEKIVSDGTSHTRTYSSIIQQFGLDDVTVEKNELYVNNIFVNTEIHDIYIERIGFSLVRVFRFHKAKCSQESNEEKLLSQLKWPIEYMMVGFRPAWNIKAATATAGVVSGNPNQWRDWHRMTRQVDANVAQERATAFSLSLTDETVTGTLSTERIADEKYWIPVSTIDSVSFTTHGVKLYDDFADTFYNQYMPMHYGGANICTPDDTGALFINMALFPGMYQPSGHLNFSRARESYLSWTSSYISASTPVDLFVVAIALNFLLITDGSAVLRYTT